MNTMPCGLMNSNAAPDKVGIFKDTRRERKAQYLPTFDPVCNRQDRKSSKYLSVATKKRTAKRPPVWKRGPSTMFAFLRKSKLSGFRFTPFNIISSKRVRRPESVYRLKRPAILLSGPNDDDLKVCRFLRASCAKWT